MLKRIGQTKIMHRAVIANGVAHLGGIVADDFDLDMEGQTRQIGRKIDAVLAEAGTDKTRIITAQIFIVDMAMKDAMNKAWVDWIPAGALPTRATIGVADLGPGVLIEVVVSALVE